MSESGRLPRIARRRQKNRGRVAFFVGCSEFPLTDLVALRCRQGARRRTHGDGIFYEKCRMRGCTGTVAVRESGAVLSGPAVE